ncbi:MULTISPECIES: hypothetical protein [Kosakonia]|jgi:hypothetical protein|uniref:hypothetical protein n=1 Tax=Kosakonia TaxID=1330547 RepID=UPI00034DAE51|nr:MULTISPECIES: hypothetical protein [Kosakonia]
MVRIIAAGCFALFSACSWSAGITLLCDEYSVEVEPNGLTVNGRHFSDPQEKPYEIGDQYTGRSLFYSDKEDQNADTNWVAIHIITQLGSGKKAFFYSDKNHTDDKAILCSQGKETPSP